MTEPKPRDPLGSRPRRRTRKGRPRGRLSRARQPIDAADGRLRRARRDRRLLAPRRARRGLLRALGRARRTGEPTALVCTSGTAAANFHPAVMEADRARVPLLVLTADRPPELRDSGANQTVDQVKLYGDAVRWDAELPEPEPDERTVRSLRTTAARALAERPASRRVRSTSTVRSESPSSRSTCPAISPSRSPRRWPEGDETGRSSKRPAGRERSGTTTTDGCWVRSRRPIGRCSSRDPPIRTV